MIPIIYLCVKPHNPPVSLITCSSDSLLIYLSGVGYPALG